MKSFLSEFENTERNCPNSSGGNLKLKIQDISDYSKSRQQMKQFSSESENTERDCPNSSDGDLSLKIQDLPDPDLFKDLSEEEMYSWKEYLYTKPRKKGGKPSLKSRVIALYDPFALRRNFAAGRRWCVNVYVGCAHSCRCCYIAGYIKNPFEPHEKKNFEKLFLRDLNQIRELGLHPAPIHVSNSTDLLQEGLEREHRHTLFLLQKLREHRKHFSTITMLTKNPAMLCELEYLEIVQDLDNFQIEVTCAFYREETRKNFEPGAPSVHSRLEAIRKLREKGITVSLRLDPIFPREPLPEEFFAKRTLKDYGAPVSHTEEDMEKLICFAAEVGCKSVIVSPLKLIVNPSGGKDLRPDYLKLYAEANGGKPDKKGMSYRMPWPLYRHWMGMPRKLGASLGIPVVFCKNNLFKTW